MTRLQDVAALAGVSVKTVSNVVNGHVHVAPHTRQRVRAAIEALGYVPNATARRLRGGRSGLIALAVPELAWPFFADLATHIVAAAEQHGWGVVVDQTRATYRWVHRFPGGAVRGVDVFRVRDGKVAEKLSYVKG